MDPIKVDFANKKGGANKKEIVIPPEKAALKIILSIVGMIVFAVIAFYVMLPAINFKSYEFYLYLGMTAASYVVFNGILSNVMGKPEYIPYVKRRAIVPGIIIAVLVLTVGIGYLVSCEFFRAKSYHNVIGTVSDREFAQEIEDVDTFETFNSVPKLDNESATELANKALGELKDAGLVSQFTASTESTQINYNKKPVRVAPLKYASIIKWFFNTREGLPGYVIIDMADESTEFVRAEIKYSTEEYFNKKLSRYLRFKYPTYLLGDARFEIKDDKTPYWICPVLDNTIGLFGGTDVKGVIIVDAATGAVKEYTIDQMKSGKGPEGEDLTWIDRVYDSDLLVQQYNFFGKYVHGFWNSILNQKDVVTTTQGYNYIAKDDDVWMYTGVTSVTTDSSITGFVLINQRTKEAQYYPVTGGTESAAQEAAQGRVKEYGYIATFPLIVNIDGQPTYFMSLKDATNIRQQYALINVSQYNKIGATSSDLSTCLSDYRKALGVTVTEPENNPQTPETPDKTPSATTATGAITEIRTAVKNGNSYYYIKLDSNAAYFSIAASKDETVVILNKGDNVTIGYSGEGAIISADSIKLN